MTLFQKCPICGVFSFAQPSGVFRCENGHEFKTTEKPKTDDDEIWEHMPEWTRKLRQISKIKED